MIIMTGENFNMQNNIIETKDNKLVVSHRVIAEQTESKEKTVSRLIRNHIDKLELFGVVGFEIQAVSEDKLKENPDSKPEKTYFLNEPQATLLLTFMRNNEIVINFKVKLVKEFFKMRTELQKKPTTKVDISQLLEESEALLKLIKFSTENPDYQLAILDKIMGDNSPLKLLNIDLSNRFFIPTELGKVVGKTPIEINKILEFRGYQVKIDGVWTLTESGKKFGIEVKGKFSQLKWKLEAVL